MLPGHVSSFGNEVRLNRPVDRRADPREGAWLITPREWRSLNLLRESLSLMIQLKMGKATNGEGIQ